MYVRKNEPLLYHWKKSCSLFKCRRKDLKVRFRKRSLDVRSIREISTHQAPEPWPDGVEVAFFDVVWVAHEGKNADGKTGTQETVRFDDFFDQLELAERWTV